MLGSTLYVGPVVPGTHSTRKTTAKAAPAKPPVLDRDQLIGTSSSPPDTASSGDLPATHCLTT